MMDLDTFASDFASAIVAVDRTCPIAVNTRTNVVFQPGIGPHGEAKTIEMVMAELRGMYPDRYGAYSLGVPYPNNPRQKCDLCIGTDGDWAFAIESKLLRMLGDNGKPNDNMLMHILSPYETHRSALTDCAKLARSGFASRTAVLIYGFESDEYPLEQAVSAFQILANARVPLGKRCESRFEGLRHPIHARGAVYCWEVFSRSDSL